MEFTTRYKKPVPLNQELKVVWRITKESSRMFEGTGEIILPSGEIAVEGFGKYLSLPLEKIADFDEMEQQWKVVHSPGDPETVDI